MTAWSPDRFTSALNFASHWHREQRVPGTAEPYLRHICTVAAEVMGAICTRGDVQAPDLAVTCALLHDTVEDTGCGLEEIEARFGERVAKGVAALTKNESLHKDAYMRDSLDRIRDQPPEIWMVKLADRITNLQPPPGHWDEAKIRRYRAEAMEIHDALHSACPVLGPRLADKIQVYGEGEGR